MVLRPVEKKKIHGLWQNPFQEIFLIKCNLTQRLTYSKTNEEITSIVITFHTIIKSDF